MSYLDKDLIELLNKKQQELNEVAQQLTFEEVLLDSKLTSILKEKYSFLNSIIDKYNLVNNLICEINSLNSTEKEIFKDEILKTEKKIYELKNEIMHQIFDQNGQNEVAIIEIQSSSDNATKLKNAYQNFCKKNNIDFFMFEDNFIKFEVAGKNVFKYFLCENGIHKYNKEKICVLAYPKQIKENPSFLDKDIKIDVFRSNGAGGQNVNKVSTAIRATHTQTNITVVCQDERSQIQNKNRAIENLKEKVEKYYCDRYEKETNTIKKKYFTLNLKRTYSDEQNIVICEDKSIALNKFLEGNYLELFSL